MARWRPNDRQKIQLMKSSHHHHHHHDQDHFLCLRLRPFLVTVDLPTDLGLLTWLEGKCTYQCQEMTTVVCKLVTVVYRGHRWLFPKVFSQPDVGNTIVRSRSGWTGWRDAHQSVRDSQDWSIIVLSGRRLDGWLPSGQILLSSQNSRGRLPILCRLVLCITL